MPVRSLVFALAAACCVADAAGAADVADAMAEGEHQRRLAAELVVMAGDVRRLEGDPAGPLERQGIALRLAGSLASLPLLLRRAGAPAAPVPALRASAARRDWRALANGLLALKRRHPFDARRLRAAAPTPETLALGASIHQSTCAACHDAPPADALLPAKNLSAQLQSMPHGEFAARLWLGVRGDKTTALANPFSEHELAALIAWYGRDRQ